MCEGGEKVSSIYNKKIEVDFKQEDIFILDGQSKICNWLYIQLLDACRHDYKYNGNAINLLRRR